MFLSMDSLRQGLVIVVVEYRHCRLSDDRSGVDLCSDDMRRTASEANARLQRLADGVQTSEAGK